MLLAALSRRACGAARPRFLSAAAPAPRCVVELISDTM